MKKDTKREKAMLKKLLIAVGITAGGYILLRKALSSETAEMIEDKIIRKMLKYHIETHKLAFSSFYGSYRNLVPPEAHAQINAALDSVIDPFLEAAAKGV